MDTEGSNSGTSRFVLLESCRNDVDIMQGEYFDRVGVLTAACAAKAIKRFMVDTKVSHNPEKDLKIVSHFFLLKSYV